MNHRIMFTITFAVIMVMAIFIISIALTGAAE